MGRAGRLDAAVVDIATGNYNPTTSRLDTDIRLLTSDSVIGDDATDLFNFLTGFSIQKEFSRLLVAPLNLRKRMMGLIKREKWSMRARAVRRTSYGQDQPFD